MSKLQQQVKVAQRRMWINRWVTQWGWSLVVAATIWALVVLTERLFVLGIPLNWTALACLGGSLVASFVWLYLSRDPLMAAAVTLDRATGLRERVSTCLHVRPAPKGPFEHAVVADAEQRIAGLPAGKFVPLQCSRSLYFGSAVSVVAMLLVLLPPFDILNSQEAQANDTDRQRELNQVRNVVQQPVSILTEIAEKNPDLEMRKDLKNLEDALRKDTPKSPDAIRRETAKTLDRFQEALKKKADSEQFKALRETKKRLRQLAEQSDTKNQLRKLAESLAASDFAQAQKEIDKLKEDLAKRAKSGEIDPEKTKELRKQLEQLSQKLQEASEDKQSQRELQNAGLSETEAKRLLQSLAKKDPQQLKKMAEELSERLKNSGMTKEQMEKMLQKMQQRQKACSNCNNMSKAMQNAAQQMSQSNMSGAMSELGEAGEMLNDLEQLEQAMNDIDSQISDLNHSRDDMQQNQGQNQGQCQHCNGTGFRPDGSPCPHCGGTGRCGGSGGQGGQGQGQGVGRGSGARQRDDDVDVDTKNVKAKVKTRAQGRIIGRQFIKGKMIKGESAVEVYDAATAAEIDATDAIKRDRIPRVYRDGVKGYFDKLGEDWNTSPAAESLRKDGEKDSTGKDTSNADESGSAATDESNSGESNSTSADEPAASEEGDSQ